MAKIKNVATFRDSLYNLTQDCHTDLEYARGLAVGLVSGLMAMGYRYEEAIKEVVFTANKDLKLDVFPECWKNEVKAYMMLRPVNVKD